MIEIDEVSATLGGTRVLDRVSARIAPGRVTALVGPNGAGKSTLLAVIGRLLKPSSGTVRLDGREISAIPSPDLARRLAILRQATQIAPRLTLRDLVGFGRYPHSGGRLGDADRAIVETCLAELDLAPFADRHLDSVSGGQRQRALIAMTLAQTPGVLLLDEPLNNLDLGHVRRTMDVLAARARAGTAVVVVLHDLTVAARFADDLVALKAGRLFASGPPEDVLTADTLSALYETDIAVHDVAGTRVVMA
ncbi:ATP-binding cassette domain-containing protein [Roseivivax isoporae]|uniref:Iron ABC transporter ATP-binding protein n=1 Tax=Roseivivax isoporae LMG 25204 TaxID=1449351 RepID=X7F7C7_9RHOB|nr:ATP-binding cassette domain-containing protein [Roseivivax isoporae]ETX28832.1 iron ABC transporter ATP-binding protein [Roseivivax isoporae LMG 25204]